MDIVLGVSLAPDSVQMVLLQGENADGATVDEKEFAVTAADDSPTVSASDRAIAAILGTREDAAGAGLELSAVGVACTDELEAKAVRDALAAHRLENVMLVSAFLAATALTQSVGGAMGYERTAVLFVEPGTATLAVVETSDGSVADVQKERLNSTSGEIATAELMEMVDALDELPTRPGGLFVVGSGVDVAPIKAHLEEATSLSVSSPEEPETALARGAALASANAPLFASSTAALAYAQDPGTGAVDASTLLEYLSIADAELGEDELAYSAVRDDEASAPTVVMDAGARDESEPRPRPGLLVGSAVAVAAFSAAMALEIALTVGIHTTVGLLPAPLQNLIAPAEQVFAPAPGQVVATKAVAPKPLSPPAGAPAPAAPIPATPVPAAPVPPAPVPPAPVAPAPVPPAPVPAAPAVPVPLVVPPIATAPVPPVRLPDPPASPPVVQAPPHPSAPAEPPPVHVPPPHSPPPHQTPPGQGPGPNPGGRGGGAPGNPGAGGPISGPGPSHGNPGGGAPPEGGGPITGPGPSHGTSGGAPPEAGGPITGPGPSHGTPGGAPPEGALVGGGTPPGDSGQVGGGLPSGGGGPVGGGESRGGGGSIGGAESPGGGGPVGGGVESGGGSHGGGGGDFGSGGSSGGGSSGGGGTESSGGGSSGGGSSGGGAESGGGGHR